MAGKVQFCTHQDYALRFTDRMPASELKPGLTYEFMLSLTQDSPLAPGALYSFARFQKIAQKGGKVAVTLALLDTEKGFLVDNRGEIDTNRTSGLLP